MKCHFYRKKYQFLINGYICIMDLGCKKGKLVEIPFLFWIELLADNAVLTRIRRGVCVQTLIIINILSLNTQKLFYRELKNWLFFRHN